MLSAGRAVVPSASPPGTLTFKFSPVMSNHSGNTAIGSLSTHTGTSSLAVGSVSTCPDKDMAAATSAKPASSLVSIVVAPGTVVGTGGASLVTVS